MKITRVTEQVSLKRTIDQGTSAQREIVVNILKQVQEQKDEALKKGIQPNLTALSFLLCL